LAAAFFLALIAADARALQITLRDTDGKPVADAVIGLIAANPTTTKPRPATMGQRDLTFVPHVLAVQTGADVAFENSDATRHHVYSFSPPKRFDIQMPTGEKPRHEIFDKPGVVAMGCNIHDNMLGFLVIMDTPHLAVSNAAGVSDLGEVPDGTYTARLWHERSRAAGATAEMTVRVWGGAIEGFNAIMDLKPERHGNPVERRAY